MLDKPRLSGWQGVLSLMLLLAANAAFSQKHAHTSLLITTNITWMDVGWSSSPSSERFYVDLCLLVAYSGNHFKKAVTCVAKDAQSKAVKLTKNVILNWQPLVAPLNQITCFGIHGITCYSEIRVTVIYCLCPIIHIQYSQRGCEVPDVWLLE